MVFPFGLVTQVLVKSAPALAVGAVGCALIVTLDGIEIQPVTDFEVTEYIPDARPVKIPVELVTAATTGFVPVAVNVIPVPGDGAVTVIVPVARVQFGCTNVVVGAVPNL